MAIAFHPGFVNWLCYLSADYVSDTAAMAVFFLNRPIKDDREKNIRHERTSALMVAGLAGCDIDDIHPEVSITSEGEEFAASFKREHDITGNDRIHPGSRQLHFR